MNIDDMKVGELSKSARQLRDELHKLVVAFSKEYDCEVNVDNLNATNNRRFALAFGMPRITIEKCGTKLQF